MASKRRLRKSETRCGAYGENLNGSIWFSFQALACCSFLVSPALSQFGLTRTRDPCRDSACGICSGAASHSDRSDASVTLGVAGYPAGGTGMLKAIPDR